MVAIALVGFNVRRMRKAASVSAGMSGRKGDVACPRCREFIKPEASICRHCQADIGKLRGENPDLFAKQSQTDFDIAKIAKNDHRVKKFNTATYLIGAATFVGLLMTLVPVYSFNLTGLGIALAAVLAMFWNFARQQKVFKMVVEEKRNNLSGE